MKTGRTVKNVCRETGISEASHYDLKAIYETINAFIGFTVC
ncbi:hypothetical protein [Edwardsiella tarda]